jgi:branched-chain amino acid transport system permease protein
VPVQSIAIDTLLALSLWATLRSGRQSLAGPGFMACGAFTASLVAPHVGASLWLCAIASGLVSLLLGVLVERSVRGLTPTSYVIATLSFGIAAPILMLAPHLARGPSHPAGNVLTAIVCLAAGTAALTWASDRFRFAAGAAAAGLAGVLYWSSGGALVPSAFGVDRLGMMVAVALVGGAGSPLAPLLSAVLLAWITRLAEPLTDQRVIVDGVVLLLALVYLPGGAWAPIAAAARALTRASKGSADGAS